MRNGFCVLIAVLLASTVPVLAGEEAALDPDGGTLEGDTAGLPQGEADETALEDEDAASDSSEEDPRPEPDDTGSDSDTALDEEEEDEGEDSGGLLDPYYDREHDGGEPAGSGCFDSCGGDLLSDLARLLFSIEVTHHTVPYRHDGVRHRLGPGGNPVSLTIEGGMTRAGGNKGEMISAALWTPSPFYLGGHFENVRIEEQPDISLLYPEAGVELLFNLPVTLSGSAHAIVAWEKERDPLTGAGLGTRFGVYLLDFAELAADYRISWISGSPFHRGSARIYWNIGHVAAWGGYMALQNCDGETADGPVAGLRLLI